LVSALQSPIKKVLLINIFGIGDVLFTTPLISNLKSSHSDLTIGYLCNRRTVSVLENNPKVNRVFVYERDEFKAVYQQSRVAYLKKVRALIE
jgi:ADP-heptose:LPS heptosyltransferase